jgi:Arc/MetJ-type ribon-helix-helix transcriptional regulator
MSCKSHAITDDSRTVGLKIPAEMLEVMKSKMVGRYSTVSEYIRDLIRTDLDKWIASVPAKPIHPEIPPCNE